MHAFNASGKVVTENHIYCRQMQALALRFEHTIICCPFENLASNSVTSEYILETIEFIALPNVGGNTFKEKVKLIAAIPAWLRAFKKANSESDIVYLRLPNNLNIPGFFYFKFKHAKTFAQYTGTWKNYATEPATYRFQKWLLKHFFKGPVWVYTDEDNLGKNIFKGTSPSYNLQEWNEETKQVEEKIAKLRNGKITKPVFISVGALVPNKNQQFILDVFKILKTRKFCFKLYIVGDGFLKAQYEKFIDDNDLGDCVILTGKKNFTELRNLYRESNFLIQAPFAEGFGKVPIEGFFHGVVPIISNTALANEMIGNNERGFKFSNNNIDALLNIIVKSANENETISEMIVNGRAYAKKHTIENWIEAYIKAINVFFE